MGSKGDLQVKGSTATITLTPDQKRQLADALKVNWDEIVIGKPTIAKKTAEGDVNIVVAMGQTHTIS